MKINKLTSALVALGFLSLAGVVQASNPVIYLTGSTAARVVIYNAATTAGQIFTNAGVVVSPANATMDTTNNGANTIVYEGGIAGIGTVDLDCNFTGSEAGIATVAAAPLTQQVNGGSTYYPLPGVGTSCTFLTQSSGWISTQALPIAGGVSTPDLTMADTSQAVSQTSATTYPLVNYGIVGVVPFTWAKGYVSSASAPWTHLTNVTLAALNQNFAAGDNFTANGYTGVTSDSTNYVGIFGRNKGSGTRANVLLNSASYGLNTPVYQIAYGTSASLYPASAPGTLTFNTNSASIAFAANQPLYYIGNDGYDSGSGVQKSLNVDGKLNANNPSDIFIGYMGISDAQSAFNPAKAGNGQVATALQFNGVYESDANVINGTYTYWGYEHLYGAIGQSGTSTAGIVATNVVAGISKALVGWGTATGDESTLGAGPVGSGSGALGQSYVIPTALMQVHRTQDYGFPAQGNH